MFSREELAVSDAEVKSAALARGYTNIPTRSRGTRVDSYPCDDERDRSFVRSFPSYVKSGPSYSLTDDLLGQYLFQSFNLYRQRLLKHQNTEVEGKISGPVHDLHCRSTRL